MPSELGICGAVVSTKVILKQVYDFYFVYSKTCLMRPLKKKTKIVLDRLSLNAGQKYCRMLEHSAILLTFITLPFTIKIFVLSTFEWPLKTEFTVFTLFLDFLPDLSQFIN